MTIEEAATPKAPAQGKVRLRVGEVLSVGGLSHGRLMALAAAAPADASDPVVKAVNKALGSDHPGIESPTVAGEDIDPASPERRYSLVRVRELPQPDGSTRDVMVMRGELDTVLAEAQAGRQGRALLRKNALHSAQSGERPLVIAAAPIEADGTVGTYRLQGFVGLRRVADRHAAEEGPGESGWTRTTLWSVSLRYQHWINVVLIFLLSCTGYYIMDPFFGPTAHAGQSTGYLMGWVRLIHFSAGFAWLLVGATRLVVSFTSRDRYLRWRTLWPLKSKSDVRNLGKVAKHYALVSNEAPLYMAHNPLQQLAYTSLYIAGGLQMCTGLILYGLSHQTSPFWEFISTPVHWFGTPFVRLVHAMMMFLLWAFAIMHIYMAVRADSLERHGGVSSMVNGGVWLRRGSKPVDAPEVE